MRAIHIVSHVEVRVLSGESNGEWVGDIIIFGDKAEIIISSKSGTALEELLLEEYVLGS